MSLAEVITVQQAEQAEAAYTAYKRVLLKSVKGGKLSASDQNEFAAAVSLLGISQDEIRKTEHAIEDHLKTTPAAKDSLEDAKKASASASALLQDHRIETNRIVEERGRTEYGLIGALQTAEANAARIIAARDRVKSIETEHWRIFGAEDPAEAAKKFCISFIPRTGPQPNADYLLYDFASLLMSPVDLSNRKLILLLGQLKADAQQMVDIVAARFAGGLPRPCFILPSGMSEPTIAGHSTLFWPISHIIQLIDVKPDPRTSSVKPAPQFDPLNYVFLPWPGLNEKELMKMVELIATTYNNHPWSANSRKNDSRYYTAIPEIQPEWLVWPTCLDRPKPQAQDTVDQFDEPKKTTGPRVWDGTRDGALQPIG